MPVVECMIGHQSEQMEAGSLRRVECEIQAIGLGATAQWLQAAAPGAALRLTGFLAAKSQRSKQLRLHLTMIEFVEGKQNGTIFQEKR